jgi:(2S)-methylsuccinyl-CoA dehydrogenase
MCVVSEELSRGYIGVGSLGTRSEIAAELILCGGTDEQKQKWLPGLASGRDPAHRRLHRAQHRVRPWQPAHPAVKDGDGDWITGNKTWITHAARTHVMTVLARTDPTRPTTRACRCSWPKRRPAPTRRPSQDPGMTGGEIEVLGYRGMKEYTVNFDDFKVKGENLLGGEEGRASSS